MQRISLSNFRVFKQETSFDLVPITILTGKNNSGKSSLFKALLLINELFESKNQFSISLNDKKNKPFKIINFNDAKNWFQSSDIIQFSIENERHSIQIVFNKSTDTLISVHDCTVINKENNSKILLSKRNNVVKVFVEKEFIPSLREKDNEKFSRLERRIRRDVKYLESLKNSDIKQDNSILKEIEELEQNIRKNRTSLDIVGKLEFDENFEGEVALQNKRSVEANFIGIIEACIHENLNSKLLRSEKEVIREIESNLRSSVTDIFSELIDKFEIDHLTPTRNLNSRIFLKDSFNEDIYKKIDFFFTNKPAIGTVEDVFLRHWMSKEKFDIGADLRYESIEGVAQKIEVFKENRWINIADMGFGIGQILLIIICILSKAIELRSYDWFSTRRSILLLMIEEPEGNLHPHFQSMIAELLSQAVKEFEINFLIETHSEYLIRKFQLMVARNELNREDILIYYFDKLTDKEDETKIKKIEIKGNGKLTDSFGEGFFDESDKHAMELFRLERLNQKK